VRTRLPRAESVLFFHVVAEGSCRWRVGYARKSRDGPTSSCSVRHNHSGQRPATCRPPKSSRRPARRGAKPSRRRGERTRFFSGYMGYSRSVCQLASSPVLSARSFAFPRARTCTLSGELLTLSQCRRGLLLGDFTNNGGQDSASMTMPCWPAWRCCATGQSVPASLASAAVSGGVLAATLDRSGPRAASRFAMRRETRSDHHARPVCID